MPKITCITVYSLEVHMGVYSMYFYCANMLLHSIRFCRLAIIVIALGFHSVIWSLHTLNAKSEGLWWSQLFYQYDLLHLPSGCMDLTWPVKRPEWLSVPSPTAQGQRTYSYSNVFLHQAWFDRYCHILTQRERELLKGSSCPGSREAPLWSSSDSSSSGATPSRGVSFCIRLRPRTELVKCAKRFIFFFHLDLDAKPMLGLTVPCNACGID